MRDVNAPSYAALERCRGSLGVVGVTIEIYLPGPSCYSREVGEWTARAAALIDTITRDGEASGVVVERREQLVAVLRGLIRDNVLVEAQFEARMEELIAVREMLATMSYPVIQVRRDVLCLPIVGPLHAQMIEEITDELLRAASRQRARWVVVDLTGAMIAEISAAGLLHRLFRALRLLGVRGALSGVSPELAVALSEQPQPLDVPVYATLAQALSATLHANGNKR